ncbi:hypothetical protein ACHQM5_004784 [Ranunculus cassubicifolius]
MRSLSLSLHLSYCKNSSKTQCHTDQNSQLNNLPRFLCGGVERLIVDAAIGHIVHIFTSYHDRTRCFEETFVGTFPVTIYGFFLPRHIFYHFHAVCKYLRCLFVALCVLLKWPSFDVVLADQVSVVVLVMKIKRPTKVVFYCHFPDLLRAKHTTALRRIYRKPIDMLEETTTGIADLILVNSKFTASTFAYTFTHLNARGNQPEVLHRAVNKKKNIQLAISALAILHSLQDGLEAVGGYDNRLEESRWYLEELKAFVEKEETHYYPSDEHFGIVPLETMAAHKPIIACNSGGPEESIIDGVMGFLCDPTPKEFATILLCLSGRRRRWVDMLDNMLESCFN